MFLFKVATFHCLPNRWFFLQKPHALSVTLNGLACFSPTDSSISSSYLGTYIDTFYVGPPGLDRPLEIVFCLTVDTLPFSFYTPGMAPKALQSVIKWLYGHSEPRVLLIGEAASGKTTFLSQLILGQVVYTIPTMGHYLTPFEYKRRTFMLWDTGSTSIFLVGQLILVLNTCSGMLSVPKLVSILLYRRYICIVLSRLHLGWGMHTTKPRSPL